jgi:hypothetical protein
MSAGKKRETMAKHARERAVREKRALKMERKREAAHLRLVGGTEPSDMPAAASESGLRLVGTEESPPAEATADREEGELHDTHS